MNIASINTIDGTIRLPNYALNLKNDFCYVSVLKNNDLSIKLMDKFEQYARSIIKNDLVASVHVGADAFKYCSIKAGDYGIAQKEGEIIIHCGGEA